MSRSLYAAYLCGATPLLIGSLIYTTWRLTRWPWLETAGLIMIAVGTISVMVGAGFLFRCTWKGFRAARIHRAKIQLHAFLAGGMLLLNVPVATIFAVSAIHIMTCYVMRVSNESGSAIESFVVTGPGIRVDLGPIAPGQSTEYQMTFSGDGSLDFIARQQQSVWGGVMEGYVTGGLGGDTTIRIMPNSQFQIIKKQN
jgi:hypothetical protein